MQWYKTFSKKLLCRCEHPAHHAFANSCICMRVYVNISVKCNQSGRQPAGATWSHHRRHLRRRVASVPTGLAGEESLRLTQAKRGFLRVFCHTIWALAPVTTPLRTHLAACGADGHLLFAASWWREKNNMQQSRCTFLSPLHIKLWHGVTWYIQHRRNCPVMTPYVMLCVLCIVYSEIDLRFYFHIWVLNLRLNCVYLCDWLAYWLLLRAFRAQAIIIRKCSTWKCRQTSLDKLTKINLSEFERLSDDPTA